VAVPIVEGLASEEFVLYCTFVNFHPQGYRVHEHWVVKDSQVYSGLNRQRQKMVWFGKKNMADAWPYQLWKVWQ
jgi:hypothetical protein